MPGLLFHPDVAIDIKVSYQWYQKQANGLGEDFINELEYAYEAIEKLPDTWPKFQKGFRRFLLSKFPFSIIYRSEKTPPYEDLCTFEQRAGEATLSYEELLHDLKSYDRLLLTCSVNYCLSHKY